MQMKFDVTGLRPLIERMAAVPTGAVRAIGRGLLKGVLVLEREVKETIYAGHEQGHLEGDTGNLRNRIAHQVDEQAMTAQVGTNVVYAPTHEFGATIVPKGHPFLAIPAEGVKGGPRDFPGSLFFLPTGDHGVLLDESLTLRFTLVRQVKIPARPFMKPALDNKGQQAADEVVREVYKAVAPGEQHH